MYKGDRQICELLLLKRSSLSVDDGNGGGDNDDDETQLNFLSAPVYPFFGIPFLERYLHLINSLEFGI